MSTIRALVVDDSFFMRKVITDILNADPEIEVIGQASDGAKALTMLDQLHPDVVSMDIEMPGMNGVETLRAIMARDIPTPTVIVSGYAQEGSDLAFRCLSAGAVDIVLKPGGSVSFGMSQVAAELRKKVKLAAHVDTLKLKQLIATTGGNPINPPAKAKEGVVVIGSSTGGPPALDIIVPQLPEGFACPIIIAQHLPDSFAPYFIDRLASRSHLPVVEATRDLQVVPGTVYIARGGTRTEIAVRGKDQYFSVEPDPANFESPSVSQLFTSAAKVYTDKTIGIILTGMGQDGLTGAQTIKQLGGRVFVQDEATSVVFGMGRAVHEAHLADQILPLDRIIPEVIAAIAL